MVLFSCVCIYFEGISSHIPVPHPFPSCYSPQCRRQYVHGEWVLFNLIENNKACVCVWCLHMNIQVSEPMCACRGQKPKEDFLNLTRSLQIGSLTQQAVLTRPAGQQAVRNGFSQCPCAGVMDTHSICNFSCRYLG